MEKCIVLISKDKGLNDIKMQHKNVGGSFRNMENTLICKCLHENSMMPGRRGFDFQSIPSAAILSFYSAMHTSSKGLIKWVAISTASIHIQTNRLALLLLSHARYCKVVLPWNCRKICWGTTVDSESKPSMSPQPSRMSLEPKATLIIKHIILQEDDCCQCCL